MGLKARRIILQVCRLKTKSICTKVPVFNCFAHCLPYKPNFAKSLDPAYITCQANFASRVGRFTKTDQFPQNFFTETFLLTFLLRTCVSQNFLTENVQVFSCVSLCTCDVFKHGQFPQNLRADTFPFISYIARQFRKISLPSLVDMFSDVCSAISLSALRSNFHKISLPRLLRALLNIYISFHSVTCPLILS